MSPGTAYLTVVSHRPVLPRDLAGSPMFGMRRVFDQPTRPVQRPIRGRKPVQIPALSGGVQRVHWLARTACQRVQRVRQVRDAERFLRGGADQVAWGADLVGLV